MGTLQWGRSRLAPENRGLANQRPASLSEGSGERLVGSRESNRCSPSPHSFFLAKSFNFQRPYAVASGHGLLRGTKPLAYTRRPPSHHHGRPLDGPERSADAFHLDPDALGRADVDDDLVVLGHADQVGQGIGHPQEVLPAESALRLISPAPTSCRPDLDNRRTPSPCGRG